MAIIAAVENSIDNGPLFSISSMGFGDKMAFDAYTYSVIGLRLSLEDIDGITGPTTYQDFTLAAGAYFNRRVGMEFEDHLFTMEYFYRNDGVAVPVVFQVGYQW
jgi:hypothetical protein